MNSVDSISCAQAFSRLDDYLDRELSAREIHEVQLHLARCAACAAHFELEHHLLDRLRETLGRIAVPANLKRDLMRSLGADAAP